MRNLKNNDSRPGAHNAKFGVKEDTHGSESNLGVRAVSDSDALP